MKKKLAIFLLVQFFITSCSFFEQKVDASDFSVKYKNTENFEIKTKIKNWWNYVLTESQNEFEKNKKDWKKVENPKISSTFKEFDSKWIKSIVYKINKKVSQENTETLVKVFYLKWKKEILPTEIINFNNEENKKIIINKIIEKLLKTNSAYQDKSKLEYNLKENISFAYFYFYKEKFYFIFDEWIAWPKKVWNIEVELDFNDMIDVLNQKTFPELKEIIKKREFEKKLKKANSIEKKEKALLDFNNWKKYVALTFDDGPNPKTTPELLDILKKYNVKATFFTLWKNVAAYPEIVKREKKEWHEIASHSWSHSSFLRLKNEQIKKEIKTTDDAIKNAIWIEAKLFRPPYWAQDQRTNKLVWKTIVMWSVDSLDWKYRKVEKNLQHTMKQVSNWSIILFHDIHQTSVDTIEPLIKKLKSEWYEFLTVSEILKLWQWKNLKQKICYSEFKCNDY